MNYLKFFFNILIYYSTLPDGFGVDFEKWRKSCVFVKHNQNKTQLFIQWTKAHRTQITNLSAR